MKVIELVLNYLQAVDTRVSVATMLVLSVPTTFCLLFWFKSPFVKSPMRLIVTVVLSTLIGWGMVVIGCLIRPGVHDGSSLILILFGWAYTWIIGLPILLSSLLIRGILRLRYRLRRNALNRTMLQINRARIVVTLLSVMILCSIITGINSDRVWRTWSGGQYRMIDIDGFVHVQIREADKFSDVATEVPACFPCDIKPCSAESLRMESLFSSVGYSIWKVDGKWTRR